MSLADSKPIATLRGEVNQMINETILIEDESEDFVIEGARAGAGGGKAKKVRKGGGRPTKKKAPAKRTAAKKTAKKKTVKVKAKKKAPKRRAR